jgi:hypothetical protein
MIACRCVIRTHTSEESQDDSMPMCHSKSHESQHVSMTMRLSNNSMMIVFVEVRSISRVKVHACVRVVLKGMRASRVKGHACESC